MTKEFFGRITMSIIDPIDPEQQALVVNSSHQYIALAGQLFDRRFQTIPINFNLTGRAAGMYHVNRRGRYIRYNPYIFSKFFDDNLHQTVPHEIAHYIADMLYGIKKIKPHGKEWKGIMHQFGVEARITCDYDLQGIPQRRHRRYTYRCHCRDYEISTRRHHMIERGQRHYHCRACKSVIRYSEV